MKVCGETITEDQQRDAFASLPSTFRSRDMERALEAERVANSYRGADRLVQKLRKQGLIEFSTKTGRWTKTRQD